MIFGLKLVSKDENKSEYILNIFQIFPFIAVALPIVLFFLLSVNKIFVYLLIASIAFLFIFLISYFFVYREFISAQFKGCLIKYTAIDNRRFKAIIYKKKKAGFMKPTRVINVKSLKSKI